MSSVLDEMRMQERMEGRTEGQLQERNKIVSSMLKKGLSIKDIAEMIDLPLEEVKKLAE